MSGQGIVVASRQSLILDLPPSCVEFCPAHPRYFVVGTYDLQKDEPDANTNTPEPSSDQSLQCEDSQTDQHKQTRRGSLVLFEVARDGAMYCFD